ncbi:MAG: hypothetical protein H3C31_11775 [Brumimicrobium sp.]|nr:hypothetical protein [Brumimicrobium sp.]MCO5268693.1 hypothetical protein [Brumimicrobium sp.]
MISNFKLFTLLFAVLVFSACTNDAGKEVTVSDEDLTELDELPKNDVVYSIPSPNEQYDLLYTLTNQVDQTIVNDLASAKNYNTIEQKALNFGVYLSDAAYLLKYNQGKKVFINYVSVLDKLGSEIDITKIYGEELLKEIESAEGDNDRLYELSSDNYLKIFDQLIENNKGAELALILTGSWIETFHILFHSAGEFNENLDIQEYILDQRYMLENLEGFAQMYGDNENVKNSLTNLSAILDMYNQLDCRDSKIEIKEKENVKVLDGGMSCVFNEKSYDDMKAKVEEIRKSIISIIS